MMTCDILPPGRHPFADDRGSIIGCDLPRGHNSPHRATLPNGNRLEWQSEDDCGCCDITDTDRCFWYGEL